MYNIRQIVKLYKFKKVFRRNNSHNDVYPVNIFNSYNVEIGKKSYGPLEVKEWGSDNEKLIIGNYVSIANEVKFILGGNHRHDIFSTYPFKVKIMKENIEAYSNGPIIIEDDVWIGSGCMIMSGVTVGRGAIIGAGSIVTKNIPRYSIVGGIPAKVIKYRFNDEIIDELDKIDFSKIDENFIKENLELLYKRLDMKTLELIRKNIE